MDCQERRKIIERTNIGKVSRDFDVKIFFDEKEKTKTKRVHPARNRRKKLLMKKKKKKHQTNNSTK